MFWNIDGAAKHLFIAAVNCVTNLFCLTLSHSHYHRCSRFFVRLAERLYQMFGVQRSKTYTVSYSFFNVFDDLAIFRNV